MKNIFTGILILAVISSIFTDSIRKLNQKIEEATINLSNEEFPNKEQIFDSLKNMQELFSNQQSQSTLTFLQENSKKDSLICRACSGFFEFLQNSNYTIQKAVLRFLAIEFCVFEVGYIRSVCKGAVDEMLNPVLDSVKNHYFDKDFACPLLRLCPQVYKTIDIQAYREDILKDKPEPIKSTISNSKPNKIIKVLHVSDIHTDLEYKEGSLSNCNEPICCREESTGSKSKEKAGKWGSVASCDIPKSTFLKFIDFVNKNMKIDLGIWSGDNTSHDIWHQSYQRNEENTKEVTKAFKEKFNFTFYPTLGNHESFPVNVYDFLSNREVSFNNFFADEWVDWIGPDAALVLKKDGYYSTFNSQYNLKIISLNSQACNDQNWFLLRDQTDPGGMLKWLRGELYDAERKGNFVYIVSHFPNHTCLEKFGLIYDALLDRFSNIIRGSFVGHSHGAEYSVVRDSKTKEIKLVNLVTSSLTTYEERLPSFRILDVDAETMRPVNFYDYRLNLTKWNNIEDDNLEWDLGYEFLKEYNLTDMSMESMAILTERLRTDNDTINKYAFNENSGSVITTKKHKKRMSKAGKLNLSYYCDTFNIGSQVDKCKNSTESITDWFMETLRGPWRKRIDG